MRDLLVFTLDRDRYGVWKDGIHSVREIHDLHALPLASSWIAGAASMDDRTVTLLDIAACIGAAPLRDKTCVTALFISLGEALGAASDEEPFGFAIGGRTEIVPVPSEACSVMPVRVKTPVFETCAILGSAVVPIIDLPAIGRLAVSSTGGVPVPGLSIPNEHITPKAAYSGPVRLFAAAEFLFALHDDCVIEVGPGADPICGLPGVPSSMRGLYARRGRALPIVDLSEYMGGRHCREDSRLLIAAEGDDAIGLLIDEDRGMVDSGEWGRSDLPPLIRTRELSAAAVTMDRIAFLLDTAALFGGKRSAAGLSELYAPDSRFSADVMRREIKVIEFQLCGMPHALPSSEVEDVVPYRTVFGVPRASAIVRGAAELGGSILPVLDLAAVYGRRTEVNPAGSIILVKNGDFRALILCEAVFEGRTLGLDSQRRLPVASPYGVVYGCYTAGNGVRLILNTEALAVNFEDVEIVDFFSALPAPVPPSAAAEPPSVKMPTQEPPLAVPAAVRRRLGGPGSARASLGSARASLGSAKASLGSAKASLGGTARIEAQATPIKSTIVEPAISPESPFAETQGIPETTPVSVRASSGGAGRRYRRLLRAAIISILLAAALVALGIVILRGGGRPEEEARPAAQTPQSMESPPLEEDALLELEVPPELPMDVEIYIVQKGDTLWDIALRFTGNPRNYPRIAGENTIPDPDLIEPGQRIRLKRKTP